MSNIKIVMVVGALAVGCGGSSSDGNSSTESSASMGASASSGAETGSESDSYESESSHSDTHQASADIVDTASNAGSFSTLLAAVRAAGLEETLRSPGPFTVFAPTDDAFAALPDGTVDTLLMPENREQLRQILTYHVVPGEVPAADVMGMDSVASVEGSMIAVEASDGSVKLNDSATVVQTDIHTSNGIIHVIDTVIMPPAGES